MNKNLKTIITTLIKADTSERGNTVFFFKDKFTFKTQNDYRVTVPDMKESYVTSRIARAEEAFEVFKNIY